MIIDKKISVSLASILVLYVLLICPLVYTHTSTLSNSLILLLSIFGFYFIGACILVEVGVADILLPISFTTLSFFFGGTFFSIILFFTTNVWLAIIALILISCAILLLKRKTIFFDFKLDKNSLFASFITILLFSLISTFDFKLQFSAIIPDQTFQTPDVYFFTSIVSTMRHGNMHSAVYEINTPINYQFLPFFLPSILCNLLDISSHQALWGLAQPLYKFLAILLCYDTCHFFLKDKLSKNKYAFILYALSFPILLAPIRPLSILRGVTSKFMYIGMTYLVPSGLIGVIFDNYSQGRTSLIWTNVVTTWPLAMALVLFCLLLFAKSEWKIRKISADKIFLALCMALLIIAKAPLYLNLMAFIGIIILKRIIFDRENILNYFSYVLLSVSIAILLMIGCEGIGSGFAHNYLMYDHFKFMDPKYFGWEPLVLGYHNDSDFLHMLIFICVLLISFLAWTSIRLLGLFGLIKSNITKLNELLLGSVVSLIIIIILSAFWHIDILDSKGKLLVDGTFDIQQFITAGYYILTIVSTIGILYVFYAVEMNTLLRKFIIVTTGSWCVLSVISLFYIYVYCAPYRTIESPEYAWFIDNYNLLKTKKYNDGLIVVNPSTNHGIMLASSDYGKYWTTFDRVRNLNPSIKNAYRWEMYKDLLNNSNEGDLIQMKREGVKYIISIPADSEKISKISILYPDRLQKLEHTHWIFELK